VQYRKIEGGRFKSRDARKARAGVSQWEVFVGARGDVEEEKETVEAELCEFLKKEDFDEPCESFVLEGEEFILFFLRTEMIFIFLSSLKTLTGVV